jgi:hypothetical protein
MLSTFNSRGVRGHKKLGLNSHLEEEFPATINWFPATFYRFLAATLARRD